VKVVAADFEDLAWLVKRTQAALTTGTKAIKAVDEAGRIRGMVAYCAWTLNAVQCHMAVDAPIVWRSLRGPAFRYPFLECGKGLILGAIEADNERSVRTVLHLGFKLAHTVVDGFAVGNDLLLFELRRDECRWLGDT
jgi:hypothetical protein